MIDRDSLKRATLSVSVERLEIRNDPNVYDRHAWHLASLARWWRSMRACMQFDQHCLLINCGERGVGLVLAGPWSTPTRPRDSEIILEDISTFRSTKIAACFWVYPPSGLLYSNLTAPLWSVCASFGVRLWGNCTQCVWMRVEHAGRFLLLDWKSFFSVGWFRSWMLVVERGF